MYNLFINKNKKLKLQTYYTRKYSSVHKLRTNQTKELQLSSETHLNETTLS